MTKADLVLMRQALRDSIDMLLAADGVETLTTEAKARLAERLKRERELLRKLGGKPDLLQIIRLRGRGL